MVNGLFGEHIKNKLGAKVFSSIRKNNPRSWQCVLGCFETNVKRTFDPNLHPDYAMPFPVENGTSPHIKDYFLTLTSAEVKGIFQPVIDQVIKLVDGQIRQLQIQGKAVSGIVLVGGFGQSSYLFNSLQDHASTMNPAPVVLQPVHAWTAVLRGAVLRGVEGKELVLSRRSRRNYGIQCCQHFNPLIHPASFKLWDGFEEEWVASGRMFWYIRKDQMCSSKDPIRFCKRMCLVFFSLD